MPIQSHDPRAHMNPHEPYCDPVNMPMPADHHAKLGRFLLLCAELESGGHRVARRLIDLDETTARILVGQPRFDDLLNLISRLSQVRKLTAAKLSRLASIRIHLRYVYSIRNIIAHQSPAWRNGWVRYDKYDTARDVTKRESLIYVASLEEIDNLNEFTKLLMWSLTIIDLNGAFEDQSRERFDAATALLAKLPLPANPAG